MRLARIAAVVVLLAVTACDRPADSGSAAPAGSAAVFKHRMNSDLSGYYMPTGEVRVGNWSFDHVFLGQAAEFQSWEAGERSATFAPVMLQFVDATSPMVETETGEAHSVTVRVLPTAYSVTSTSISFVGRSPELGAISFEGMLDPGALATARRNLGNDGTVVTGVLKVGNAPARNVQLRWWGGD
jgi:hypothetical protein